MNIGELRDRIGITMPSSTQNAIGETVQTYADSPTFTVWAAVRQQGNAEQVRNGLNATDGTYAIRIRYHSGVTTAARISYRGRVLDVLSVVEGGQGNREWMQIVARGRQ